MQSCYSLLVMALISAAAAGCDDAGRRPIQARPAVEPLAATYTSAYPTPLAAQQGATQDTTRRTVQLAPLPLWSRDRQAPTSLLPAIPDGRNVLISRVEEKFAAGEANFKAGHLDAARRDFNDAVDWMLESGYDPNSDPRLSELFHRVIDTVYTYELQAFRAGDGFSEAPAVPAAIDEVAEM